MKYIITRVLEDDDNREYACWNGEAHTWDERPSTLYEGKTEIDEMNIDVARLRATYPQTTYKVYLLTETTL